MDSQIQADQMTVSMARLLKDGERVFHGVSSPLPMIAILLAKKLHAPNLVYLNIAGGVNPSPERVPSSTLDPVLAQGSPSIFSLIEIFDLSARGELDTVFLGGVQVDRYGRINLSAIGKDYWRPKVRLPGGAGSAALMPTAKRTILWRTKHTPKTFIEKLDFVTAAGRVDRIVTPLCVFALREGEILVESIHPYIKPEEVIENTGFPVQVDANTPITPPPTPEELKALHALDPSNIRLIEFK
ncbi:MAG: CoA-transferase [candidate division NC10 bacterium]|nr:CoA-transferase [candidate division NC10 bacterium]